MRGADAVCTQRFIIAVGAFRKVADFQIGTQVAGFFMAAFNQVAGGIESSPEYY